MMKTFLLLSVSSVATAGALPSLPAKIILSAFVLMAVLTQAARRAPMGYQDEDGFMEGTTDQPGFTSRGHPPSLPKAKNN